MNHLVVCFVVFLIGASSVWGAIPIQQAASEKQSRYVDRGVFVGGYDKGGQILKSLRAHFDKETKVERVVLDLSSLHKDLAADRPGFFHISIQKDLKRILVSLENITENKVSSQGLLNSLAKSHFIKGGRFYYDEFKKNLTIELEMNKTAKVEVFELSGVKQNGRIVLDIK